MPVDGRNGNGPGEELPWASVFDSAANMRALSAIQFQGLRAASALVDRVMRAVTAELNGRERVATPGPYSREQRADLFGATDIEPLIRSWWAMAGQLLLGAGSRVPDSATVSSAALDLSTADARGRVMLDVIRPGTATAQVWLSNSGVTDLGTTRLRCSDLLADDGSVVDSSSVTIDPGDVPLPGKSSRGIDISISVGEEASPGLYRGTVVAQGHPDVWLPAVLIVRAPAE